MHAPLSPVILNTRKTMIFRCGVLLMFFTSMSKVLIPGAIFDPLQHDLGLNAAQLAQLGASYMYAYAISQFLMGIFSDRVGGVRILVIGGLTFTAGMLIFPFSSALWLLMASRFLAGLGAGTVFLGCAKLIADLYPQRFSAVLGYALLISYFGPVTGTAPMVWLANTVGWRLAMLIPAIFSLASLAGILAFVRGTFQPIKHGESLWNPVLQVMRRIDILRLFVASSLIFGSYYVILTLMGRKCLEDAGGFSTRAAAIILMVLPIIVASCNLFAGVICRTMRNRYGLLMMLFSAMSLAGGLLGGAVFHFGLPGWCLLPAYLLVALPAGFFPVYSTMAKDNCPPELTGLVVALVNFWAFVAIAGVGDLAGRIMRSHEFSAQSVNNVIVYPPDAYLEVFALFILTGFIGLACTFGLFRHRKPQA